MLKQCSRNRSGSRNDATGELWLCHSCRWPSLLWTTTKQCGLRRRERATHTITKDSIRQKISFDLDVRSLKEQMMIVGRERIWLSAQLNSLPPSVSTLRPMVEQTFHDEMRGIHEDGTVLWRPSTAEDFIADAGFFTWEGLVEDVGGSRIRVPFPAKAAFPRSGLSTNTANKGSFRNSS
jgi:hypothetical protein